MSAIDQTPPGVSFHSSSGGQMASLIHAKDWSQTSLGPMESWPETLKGYVNMIMTLPAPAIIFWGPDQIQIYNDGYAVIMGPRHPKYLGATYKECWPETYPTIYPWMKRVIEQGEVVKVDRALIPLTRHGFDEEAFFSFSFSPLENDEGRISGILQIVTEMTETILAERRLNTVHSIIPIATQKPGEVHQGIIEALKKNPNDIRFALLFSKEESEISLQESFGIGEGTSDSLDSKELVLAAERAFSSNKTIEIVGEKALALPIRRSVLEHPKGVLVLGISPRLHFDEKYYDFFQSLSREIAAALLVEQETIARIETAREKERLFSVFQQAPVAVCVFEGPDHKFVLANSSYLSFFGGPREIIGKSVRQALPEMGGQGFFEILDQVYKTGEAYIAMETPATVAQMDGSLKSLYVNSIYKPKLDSYDKVDGIVAVITDVTEQVQARNKIENLAQRLKEAVKARDEFLSIASHELKTPLTSLKLLTQLFQRSRSRSDTKIYNPDRVDYLVDQSERQVSRLIHLVDDMLDISRIRTGKLSINREPVDLCDLVSEVMDRLKPSMIQAGSPPEFICAEKIEGLWDQFRMEQVITNLLTNAMKYGNNKPVRIRLEKTHKDLVRISVEDRGIGIHKEAQNKIFDRFERAMDAKNISGLGLGLFISKQIVESHGGRIWVQSEIEKGSTFFVELPIMDKKEAEEHLEA